MKWSEPTGRWACPGGCAMWALTKKGVRQIAEDAMTDFGLHRNIRPVSDVAELEGVLEEAW